jgi:hypothetical protein
LLSKYPLIANVLPPRRSRPPRAWRAAARTQVRRVVRTKAGQRWREGDKERKRGSERERERERWGEGGGVERLWDSFIYYANDTIKASEFYLRHHLG